MLSIRKASTPPVCLVSENSSRLASLWTLMMSFGTVSLMSLIDKLAAVENTAMWFSSNGRGGTVSPQHVSEFGELLKSVDRFYQSFGFDYGKVARALGFVYSASTEWNMSHIEEKARTLKSLLYTEAYEHCFLVVNKSLTGYVDNEQSFGEQVNVAFPSAALDIKESGNCLAADCNTAAVFHLMRAVEFALRALSVDRHVIPKNKPITDAQWGELLNDLSGKLTDLRNAPRASWRNAEIRDEQIRFYNSVVQEIRSFNDAWRRHVSHADTLAFYDQEQALSIMNHVCACMQNLATKISETSVTPEFWS